VNPPALLAIGFLMVPLENWVGMVLFIAWRSTRLGRHCRIATKECSGPLQAIGQPTELPERSLYFLEQPFRVRSSEAKVQPNR